ncbi:MAG: BrnA antitoxin family protein [Chloroflexi bacterium]|nr:BrnA antitoxin family protein [Chloroflexota bacterium]
MVRRRAIPRFDSEDEERAFWQTHEATDFIAPSQFRPAQFPRLRPSVKTISIRLPESLVHSLQVMAHKRDVSYQSLVKLLLTEAIEREHERGPGAAAQA